MKEENIRIVIIATIIFAVVAMIIPASATDWPQFQKDEINSGQTADNAPISGPTMVWNYDTEGGGWSGIDTTPIVADGKVFTINYQGYLYAFDAKTGDHLWDTMCNPIPGQFELSTPAYHNGIVYVSTSSGAAGVGNGRVSALNADTGNIINFADLGGVVTGFQLNTPITYADGKIYVGSWKGGITHTEDFGTYYCLDADNLNLVWSLTPTYGTGFYWAGAAIVNNYIIFGDDRSVLTCLNKNTGEYVDQINVSSEYGLDAKEIRSSIVWNDAYDRLYFTSKGGYAFAIGFNSNGQFTTDHWYTNIGYSTSTPAVYDGRVYVGQGGFGAHGRVYCLHESNGANIWETTDLGGVQSSPTLSIVDGHKYIYFTVNNEDGSAYCLEDKGSTFVTRWVWNPPLPDEQYILQGFAISDDLIYFGTDEGYVYALAGMCGDVDGDGRICHLDAIKVFRRAIYNEPVCSDWAADVDCDERICHFDAIKVFRRAIYQEPLNCCIYN